MFINKTKNQDFADIVRCLEEVFTLYPSIKVAILFGSAAHSRLTPTSDIDIAVAASRPLESRNKIRLVGALAQALGRDIDLVDLQSVSGPILQQSLCRGEIIKKDAVIYPFLLKKMWFNQADMMPLTRMVLERHCRRFVNG